jgi:sigma-B regulation protein RsbU (phosphoserine phosphatase)
VSDVIVDGDRVAVLSAISATDNKLGWFGLPPTGGPIDYRMVLLLTIVDGRIVRDERIYDSAGVLERLEKSRVDKELRTAAEMQRALLSRTAHLTAFSESAGHSVPCRAIGGDFFEFLELPSGAVGVAMGDVAGKGPAAALLAAMLQGMLESEASIGDGPAAVLTRINRRLAARRLESRFATLVFGVLAPDGWLVYANAGHNPPVIAGERGIRHLTAGGTVLGMFPDATFGQEEVRLEARDTLVLFTDGVTEARSASDEEFGEDRLLACLDGGHRAPPADLLNRIFAAVRQFSGRADQSDDVTVTVTRFG